MCRSNGTVAIVVRVARAPSRRFATLVNDASSITLPASVRVNVHITLTATVAWRMSPAASLPLCASNVTAVSALKRFRSTRWRGVPL